jgi:integrase/recombinase XerD
VTIVTAAVLVLKAQEFLRFKRAMGISYGRAEFVLDGFVRFAAQH